MKSQVILALCLLLFTLAVQLRFSKPEPLAIGGKYSVDSLSVTRGFNNNIGVIWSEEINKTWVLKTRSYNTTISKWSDIETHKIVQGQNYTKEEGIYLIGDQYEAIVSLETSTQSLFLREKKNGTWIAPYQKDPVRASRVMRIAAEIDEKNIVHIAFVAQGIVPFIFLIRSNKDSTAGRVRDSLDQHIYIGHVQATETMLVNNYRSDFGLADTSVYIEYYDQKRTQRSNKGTNMTDLSVGFNRELGRQALALTTIEGQRYVNYMYYDGVGFSEPVQSKKIVATVNPGITSYKKGYITLFNVWDGDASSLHADYRDHNSPDGEGEPVLVAPPTYAGKDYLNIVSDGNLVHAMWVQPTMDDSNMNVMYSFSELA
jgi:hypothetical protein